jgi:hypothetical protein
VRKLDAKFFLRLYNGLLCALHEEPARQADRQTDRQTEKQAIMQRHRWTLARGVGRFMRLTIGNLVI